MPRITIKSLQENVTYWRNRAETAEGLASKLKEEKRSLQDDFNGREFAAHQHLREENSRLWHLALVYANDPVIKARAEQIAAGKLLPGGDLWVGPRGI